MPIEFHCPFCDQMLRTPDAKAGLQAACPGCGEKVFVPNESELTVDEDDSADSRGADWFDQLGQLEAKPREKRSSASRRESTGPSSGETTDCPMCGEEVDVRDNDCPACGEPTTGKANSRRENPNNLVYAGFWLRLVAAIIDGLILGIPTSAVVAIVMVLFQNVPWLDIMWMSILTIRMRSVKRLDGCIRGLACERIERTEGFGGHATSSESAMRCRARAARHPALSRSGAAVPAFAEGHRSG